MFYNPIISYRQKIMWIILTIITSVGFFKPAYPIYNLKPGGAKISDFEYHPNSFGGNVGAYGAMTTSGYSSDYAYSGEKSYKLVFAEEVFWRPEHEVEYETTKHGTKRMKAVGVPHKPKKIDWATFMLDLGPIVDESVHPVKIQAMNISRFRYLVFWVRGGRGGEKFKIYFRDAEAGTYEPQLKLEPNVVVTKEWKAVAVNLEKIGRKVDLKNMVQIGIGFGREDGNKPGNVIYVDNFILVK